MRVIAFPPRRPSTATRGGASELAEILQAVAPHAQPAARPADGTWA